MQYFQVYRITQPVQLGELSRSFHFRVFFKAVLNATPEYFALYVAVSAVGYYRYTFVKVTRQTTFVN
jgi:hypothetical protein